MKKIALILFISLISCQPEGRVYVQHQELSAELEWKKDDIKEFKVPVENNDQLYDMSLSFRYATGFQFQVVKIKVLEISPSGKENTYEYDLKVREDNGDYLGEAGLDIWDSEHLVIQGKKYEETGIYTYRIEHNMSNDPLNFAMEVGMILDKAK